MLNTPNSFNIFNCFDIVKHVYDFFNIKSLITLKLISIPVVIVVSCVIGIYLFWNLHISSTFEVLTIVYFQIPKFNFQCFYR